MGGCISMTPRRPLPPADNPRIRLDLHDGRVQHLEFQPPAEQSVGMLKQQIDVVDGKAGDFHWKRFTL